MKQLTCEMCGSTDLMKQDGVFVCQACGTKYSVEEAKKMMVEGSVDVSGSTVKIDSSEKLDNLYLLARRARDNSDDESALKYYEQIVQDDPNSWEANYYRLYYKVMTCKVIQIGSMANTMKNSMETLVDSVLKMECDHEEKLKAVTEIIFRTIQLCDVLYVNAKEYAAKTNDDVVLTQWIPNINALLSAVAIFVKDRFADDLGISILANTPFEKVIQNLKDDYDEILALAKETYRQISYFNVVDPAHKTFVDDLVTMWQSSTECINDTASKIQETQPGYEPPVLEEPSFPNKGVVETVKGGCYVATAVYGSYDCPQVWTLRRFRDYTLAETWYGRAFIRTYCAISPTLVKWFGKTEWFKKMWQGKLDSLVAKLQSEGVESTPYEDKEW